MATTDSGQTNQPPFTDVLKQLHFEDPAKLAEIATGEKIAKRIYSMQSGQPNSLNFFTGRAAHWDMLDKWSLGKQDMSQFLPYMNIVDANKAYAKIDLTPIMIGAQFVGTKIESIAKNDEYPCVKAIDDGSMDEKEQRQLDALFRMREVQTIHELQQKTGLQLEPSNAYVPDDDLSAKVYFELEDQLPKEIRFQKLLADTLTSNDYNRVIKPKLLRNNIVFNFECTKVEKEAPKKYSIRACIPKNMFYNCIITDTGKNELQYIGEAYNLKVADIRSKWGKSETNPQGLTEQQIYDFARKSTQNTPANPMGFNHQFNQQYQLFTGYTPWDDYSGYVIDFEIKVTECDYYISKIDSYGKENVVPKKGIPKPKSETASIQKKNKTRWYRGVYAPFAGMMIYWGVPELRILDYTNTESSLCSYTPNIPNNNGEYAPSLFERALEPLKEYALIKLKRKLLLGKLSPATYRIDVESARNVVTGTGKVYEWEEIVQIKDTTGVELWSSKGLDPLTSSSPVFSAPTADPTLQNINQLTELLSTVSAEIRVLLGVPVYLDGSDVGDRTPAKLAQGQTESSFNVTGFVPNGHTQCIEETLNKICILSWQDIVTDKKESDNDLINTRFKTSVKMKMADYEKQQLEADIQRYSQMPDAQGNPSITPKDANMLRNIDDFKLANWYLDNKWEENRRKAIQDSQRLQEQNATVQQQSAQQAAEQAAKIQEQKISAEKDMLQFKTQEEMKVSLVNGWMMGVSKGVISPNTVMPILSQLGINITIPLQQENKQMGEEIQEQQMQEEAAEEQSQGQPQMQPNEQGQLQGQPQMAQQPVMQ